MILPVDPADHATKEVHAKGATFDQMLVATRDLDPIPTAVVHPCDEASLEGALYAQQNGLITPILVGPEAKIRAAAKAANLNIQGIEIVPSLHSHDSAKKAVCLVHEAKAQALMKGALHTDELMGEVVHKERGLRTERRMSHIFVLDVPTYPKPLLISDAAINIFPDLETKADIVQNAIELAQAIGVDTPKVAILSALETVNPRIPSTVEAAALCKMADRRQITGGILDGPLAFDNAVSKEAAETKGIVSDVAGDPDILIAPDLEAGNMIAKQLMYLAGADSAGLVLGGRVPVMLTSRADGTLSRVVSAALAQLLVHHRLGKGIL
ncbi:bifunctional enoyl-CoA hydratase/phosphate acetyltransferase [Shimia aestuarii]|uniref:bifunctional enoyl-CoA hydratase/phosphate acetyltransferase n=1 Tax=Shimia aestuarii TaxID=254406 RepID=UPI001FB567C1|nr:bifunctional enoyl-CoA hydratase/phosphate acetyltransferase [Shimia aestuarii]